MTTTIKVIYNAAYGGFNVSDIAIKRYAELKGFILYPESNDIFTTYWIVPPEARKGILEGEDWYHASLDERMQSNKAHKAMVLGPYEFDREDQTLVQVIEELGKAASGLAATLMIAELVPGTRYRITEYDGYETIELCDEIIWDIAGAQAARAAGTEQT
jgi:hypothetical protein